MPLNTDVSALQDLSKPLPDFLLELIWTCLPSVLLYGMLGLALAIVLMVWIAKKNLLRRRPRAWNALAKLSYVLILAGTLAASVAVGVVRHLQQEIMVAFETTVTPVVRTNTVLLRQYVTMKASTYAPGRPVSVRELVDSTLKDFYYKPASDSPWEHGKAGIVNWTLRKLGGDVLTLVFQQVIIGKAQGLADALKTDIHGQPQGEAVTVGVDLLKKMLFDANHKADMKTLDRTLPQIILDLLRQHINAGFHQAYMIIATMWLAAAMAIGAEMLLYFRWYEKRHSAA